MVPPSHHQWLQHRISQQSKGEQQEEVHDSPIFERVPLIARSQHILLGNISTDRDIVADAELPIAVCALLVSLLQCNQRAVPGAHALAEGGRVGCHARRCHDCPDEGGCLAIRDS